MSDQPTLLSGDDRVQEVDIADRMEQSFLDYSMSVIIGRALPDVRDGLKPVQRRILYGMWEAGMRPDRPYRKCAAAVGDVMRKYHPHGDVSIYDALVRMAQDFSSREPLVDGQGNFGSVDGDGAAAMRYTEARLSPIAMELLAGIDEDTVDLVANYDGEWREPVVLPARFPNVLVNGASGIAVGMATSIPPHNLGETVEACRLLIDNPDATVDDLMGVLPAPDFPTGGRILNTSGIRDAYLTGRGAITTEAVATTETRSGGLPRIVVTEIPYQVNKATLLEKIADHVKNKKVDEIRDLRDESSRDGMRVVIELKRGEDPGQVLAKLYDLTDLRLNFNANLVTLVDGQPRTVGLREILLAYLDHQREVLVRRTTHRRDKAAARVHVLEGLLTALEHLDDVIALIRAADTVDDARTELMTRYELSETQATAVLDMQLRRLAALERQKLIDEHEQLVAYIEELEALLADPGRLDELLATELGELAERHPSPRRSQLADPEEQRGGAESTGEVPTARLAAQEVTVYVTAGGYLKPVERRRTAKPHSHARDPVVAVLRATTEDTVLAVDVGGTGYRIALADVPVVTMRQRGTTLAQLLGEAPAEPLAGAVVLSAESGTVVTASAAGQVKRTEAGDYESRTRVVTAAGVRDKDRLVRVTACRDDDDLLLAHDAGQVIRFPAAEVRAMGRTAAGVTGMRVPDTAAVVSLSVLPGGVDDDLEVVTVAADGGAKRVPLAEYPSQSRGGKGVQAGVAKLAWCGLATDLHVPTEEGLVVLRPADTAAGRRSGPAKAATAAVTGPVVGEQGA